MIKNTFLTIFIYYCVVLKPNNINNLKNIIPRTYEFHEWCIKPPILMYRNNKMHLIYNTLFWMSSFNTNFKIISTILAATLKFPLLLSFYFINYPHKLYFLFIPPTIPFKLFLIQQYVSQKQPVFQDTWRTLSIFRRTLHIFTYFTTCSFSILYMKIYLSI